MHVDAVAHARAAQPELYALLERAGPYGSGHPEPLFVVPSHQLVDIREVGSGGHLKLRVRSPDGVSLDAMAFRTAGTALGQALNGLRGGRVHLAGTLSLDRWQGTEKATLRVVDAAEPQGSA